MPDSQNAREFPPAAVTALSRGQMIEAIKIVRQQWSVDLKQAKDAVDAYVRAHPTVAATNDANVTVHRGGIPWLIVVLVLGLALAYFFWRR
jgi:ribosomal protein L7/L12